MSVIIGIVTVVLCIYAIKIYPSPRRHGDCRGCTSWILQDAVAREKERRQSAGPPPEAEKQGSEPERPA